MTPSNFNKTWLHISDSGFSNFSSYLYALLVDPYKNIYLGSAESNAKWCGLISKYAGNGRLEWQTKLVANPSTSITNISPCAIQYSVVDKHIYVLTIHAESLLNLTLSKITEAGQVIWLKLISQGTVSLSGNLFNNKQIAILSNGNIVVLAGLTISGESEKTCVLLFNNSGTIIAQKFLSIAGRMCQLKTVLEDNSGNLLIGGNLTLSNHAIVLKLLSDLSTVLYAASGTSNGRITDMLYDPTEDIIYLVGYVYDFNAPAAWCTMIAKFDYNTQTILWSQVIKGVNLCYGFSITKDQDYVYAITANNNYNNVFINKLDVSTGNIVDLILLDNSTYDIELRVIDINNNTLITLGGIHNTLATSTLLALLNKTLSDNIGSYLFVSDLPVPTNFTILLIDYLPISFTVYLSLYSTSNIVNLTLNLTVSNYTYVAVNEVIMQVDNS